MSFTRYAEMNSTVCTHKISTGCCLTHTRGCCACTDQRPYALAYPSYVDGEGIKYQDNRWERYCWKCKDYWNTSYPSRTHSTQALPPFVSPELPRIRTLRPLSPSFTPALDLQSPSDTPSHTDICPPDTASSVDGSSERIARLRSDLQGVRTDIQRIATGLQDLSDNTRQQELVGEATFGSFRMTTPPGSPPRPGSEIPSHDYQEFGLSTHQPPPNAQSTVPSNVRMHPVARARNASEQILRSRQRAFLDLDRTSQANTPTNTTATAVNNSTLRNPHRRPVQENLFSALGAREEAERPDYLSPMANMYGIAWGEYRTAELNRQNVGSHGEYRVSELNRQSMGLHGSNISSMNENQHPAMANPLISPFATTQQPPATTYHGTSSAAYPRPTHYNFGRGRTGGPDLISPLQHTPLEGANPSMPMYAYPPHNYTPSSFRRQQNSSAPTQPIGNYTTPQYTRRGIDGHRRGGNRGESEGTVLMRSRDISGEDPPTTRMAYPYLLPGALARDQYLAELHARESASETESEPALTFDTQSRPPPMEPEEMMVDMSCSICKEHVADTVVLPCGHAVMCSWCADLQVPCRKREKSTPRDKSAKCPMCRTRIKQKFKIYHS